MIITRTPFRVSFCGGGSDLASFYEQHGGCVLSSSINKYMYISVHPYFDEKYTSLKYSENELVDDLSKIKHRILNSVLNQRKLSGVEISSTADVPAGTGLGSSSTFTVGLLHAIYSYKGQYVSKATLAEEACEVEINRLGAPIGKQDQYAAAFGGLNFIRFKRNGSTSVEPIMMKPETYNKLQNNLIMFYTGTSRSANTILSEQKNNISQQETTKNLQQMCTLAEEMKAALQEDDLSSFGEILNRGWLLKKTLASGISNPDIDHAYDVAMENGALGGKLLGAGGGGFFLFYCEPHNQEKLRTAIGLKKMDFKLEYDGSSVVHVGDKYWN
ncbi:hypothetical protein J4772_33165 [Cohnella sp. LGH]|uniref:GHMP family kinase ATP-binding protein n=1 Tax=Cohnella sp. LGH TaxID=1619153 RepID=UPI001ADA1D18|nr:hypothetical protein [Cohnella sp. LGH]QTH42274.1 hypothetical protein J4772_33165 [Cohnella sp. LGH]